MWDTDHNSVLASSECGIRRIRRISSNCKRVQYRVTSITIIQYEYKLLLYNQSISIHTTSNGEDEYRTKIVR